MHVHVWIWLWDYFWIYFIEQKVMKELQAPNINKKCMKINISLIHMITAPFSFQEEGQKSNYNTTWEL